MDFRNNNMWAATSLGCMFCIYRIFLDVARHVEEMI